MLFLKKRFFILSCILMVNSCLKYIDPFIYIHGKYQTFMEVLKYLDNFDFLNFFRFLTMFWFGANVGYIGNLYLNGLGFKSTRKKDEDKKHWRFNVGHSHVFKYYPPKDIIMKIKVRLICIYGFNKMQVMDIVNKLRSFHFPDPYKGVGMKYLDEIIRLKKGKIRQ